MSYYGEYSNEPTRHSIDRKNQVGVWYNGAQFRYFTPTRTADETGNPDSPMQDFRRMEAYNDREWSMIGITAVATFIVNDAEQIIKSSGRFGIESDCGEKYLIDIEESQKRELMLILTELGIS